ncbi:DDE superfamily endonuclease [Hirsutella rhossiliensis]
MSLRAAAKEFGVPRDRLRLRFHGIQPRSGHKPTHTRLSPAQEDSIDLYIDRLERIGLALAESVPHVTEYFKKLHETIASYGINPADIWNMDETGFRIGIGRDQVVVTKSRRSQYFGIEENRESATAVEAISADGRYIPAFLILSGKVHLEQWYGIKELDGDTLIGVTETGFTNDQLNLAWIQHFDKHAKSKGAWRLLLLDGHGSTIPLTLSIDFAIRSGASKITKLEFLAMIQSIRVKAFKESTILSAFKNRNPPIQSKANPRETQRGNAKAGRNTRTATFKAVEY